MSLPPQGLSWACLVIRGNARGDIKKLLLTLSAVVVLVCKVFPSVQLGMKRHAEALPSKDHWSGGSKIRDFESEVKGKKSTQAFQFLLGSESFPFLQHLWLPPRLERKPLGCFPPCSSPGPSGLARKVATFSEIV